MKTEQETQAKTQENPRGKSLRKRVTHVSDIPAINCVHPWGQGVCVSDLCVEPPFPGQMWFLRESVPKRQEALSRLLLLPFPLHIANCILVRGGVARATFQSDPDPVLQLWRVLSYDLSHLCILKGLTLP